MEKIDYKKQITDLANELASKLAGWYYNRRLGVRKADLLTPAFIVLTESRPKTYKEAFRLIGRYLSQEGWWRRSVEQREGIPNDERLPVEESEPSGYPNFLKTIIRFYWEKGGAEAVYKYLKRHFGKSPSKTRIERIFQSENLWTGEQRRINFPYHLSIKEIMRRYGISHATAYRGKKRGYFYINYHNVNSGKRTKKEKI